MKLLNGLLDYFFPSVCLSCRDVLSFKESHLCTTCDQTLKFLNEPFCLICGDSFSNLFIESHHCQSCLETPPAFRWARSVFEFEETVSKIIYSFKYHGNEMVLPWFRSVFSFWIEQHKIIPQFDYIIPVPLHPFRLRRRGYNQSLLLAREIGKILEVPVEYRNLIRKDYEKPQSSKSREKRKKEIRNVFALKDKTVFKDKKILLVDDVYTTGATVKECGKLLKQGEAEICVFTLARTPLIYSKL